MRLRLLPLLLAIAAPLAFAQSVNGGNGYKASANTAVQIIAPITLTANHGLSFGTLVIDQGKFSSGSMKVDASNTVTPTFGHGTSMFLGHGHQTPQAAQFAVNGEAGYPFIFSAGEFTITGPPGTVPWRVVPDVMSVPIYITSGNISNPTIVNVGGTLYINNGVPGTYTGTMLAGVIYQ
jgi:hypothetical protein